ncbi:MAG: hypothetical protein COW63_03195 [Bacteroidetes bacterium CG18_big_fil_WC_8_21_14_2_50_41_14]|nr:MAG: hypothetical protein COW63_03195 [Bacteroidetes bacterium CG18_big_fil_WC_8_21_14_2_50_41_14]PJB59445.1 MAG: hypothetical protein CO098_03395 [Bacteroidetes bacterium CG_4_9_14_3_um_filter_41_19]
MMKHFFTFLVGMMFAFSINAQYIYNDFDANQNETFLGDPNIPTVVANPDISGINTSAGVAEWLRAAGSQWTHVYTIVEGTIDFSTGTTFQLKVYSPIACEVLFKLEASSNPAISTEVMGNVTTPNAWQLITYDFTGAASGTYDKVVIFFDFATTTENTFYFDDVIGPEYSGGGVGVPVTLPVTFDDPDVNYGLTDFGGNSSEIIVDPTDDANKVAKTIKTESAELWAGTTVGGVVGFPTPIPFAEGSTIMSVKVWSPAAGTPIRLKVEDFNDVTITCETETNTTVAADWEIILFDFSNEAPGTAELNLANNYNKASIFFNFGTTGAVAGEQTYYWDDMEFVGGTEEKPLLALDVQDNFENDGYGTIADWKFQDAPELTDLLIVGDPVNASNHVADYNRSGAFEWTNAQFILDHRMDLTNRNKFELKVYFPSSNDYTGTLTPTASMKLQNSLLGANAWTTQTEVKLDVTEFDSWVSLLFDFSAVADRIDYDQVVVQLGGEGHFVPGQFYFDDIYLIDYSSVAQNSMVEMSVYPNPAYEVLNVNMQLVQSKIYSVTGQKVYQSHNAQNTIDISQLHAGIYLLTGFSIDGNEYKARFIKK